MSTQTLLASRLASRTAPLPVPAPSLADGAFLHGVRAVLLVAGGSLLAAGVAWLDHRTGSRFSFSLFYLIPAAACAWLGGFASGTLLALVAAAAWHKVDMMRDPATPLVVLVWNGVVRFCVLTLVASLVSRLHAGIRRERLLARTDPLTGAANGRTFYDAASTEAGRARRGAGPLTLAYFDLDNFKQLNDRLGHAAGDAALRQFVESVRSSLRRTDVLARLGGDEFALLLPGTGPDGAVSLLERVREAVSRAMSERGWPVTLSVGAVTFLQPPPDVDLMVRRVDALMYAAKRKGKCCMEHEVAAEDLERPTGPAGLDRRATARVVGDRHAKVRSAGDDEGLEEYATLRDISASGIALRLGRRFPDGTVLLVEPLADGAKALLARVVRSVPDQGGWRHGCELSIRLDEGDIGLWLGECLDATPLPAAVRRGPAS